MRIESYVISGFIVKYSRHLKKKRSKALSVDMPILDCEILSERVSKNEIRQALTSVENLSALFAQKGKAPFVGD
jgi:hypothetical protein